MTAPAESAAGAVWTATTVARRLGVAPATLRSWSRRYGIGPAAHTRGRHRRYSATDVAELEAIHALVADGVALPAAASIVQAQRRPDPPRVADPQRREPSTRRPPAGATVVSTADAVAHLAAAASGLDSATVMDLAADAMAGHGVLTAWEQLFLPALTALDPAVADDVGCADSHLLLSRVLGTCLRRIPAAPGDHPVLLACTVTEQHSLGLEALAAALAERGIPTRMLGATVPAAAMLHAAARLRPRAVVVWSQRPATARTGLLRQLGAHTDTVIAAGPGWRHTPTPAGTTGTERFRTALALVAVTRPATEGVEQQAGSPESARPADRDRPARRAAPAGRR